MAQPAESCPEGFQCKVLSCTKFHRVGRVVDGTYTKPDRSRRTKPAATTDPVSSSESSTPAKEEVAPATEEVVSSTQPKPVPSKLNATASSFCPPGQSMSSTPTSTSPLVPTASQPSLSKFGFQIQEAEPAKSNTSKLNATASVFRPSAPAFTPSMLSNDAPEAAYFDIDEDYEEDEEDALLDAEDLERMDNMDRYLELQNSAAPKPSASIMSPAEMWRSCMCCKGNPYACSDPECSARGVCDCCMEEADEGEAHLDEWIPKSSKCACCHGYIHQCNHLNPECGDVCACKKTGKMIVSQ